MKIKYWLFLTMTLVVFSQEKTVFEVEIKGKKKQKFPF
jgi:hypothetical protein